MHVCPGLNYFPDDGDADPKQKFYNPLYHNQFLSILNDYRE